MQNNKKRPKFINLLQIRFPVAAILSIGHRASGVFLFLLAPLLIYAFDQSLASAEGYAEIIAFASSTPARVGLVVVIWALTHHLFAGIRFLLIDVDIGVERARARASAWVVQIAGCVVMLIAAGCLL